MARPTRIRNMLEMLWQVPQIILNREVDLLCGYLCYTTLLSLIPLIVLLLFAGRFVGAQDRDTYHLVAQVLDLLTPESAARLKQSISELYQNVRIKRLGLTAMVPLLLFLFMKIRMIRASFVKLLGESKTFPWILDLLLFVTLLAVFPLLFSVLDALVLSQIPRKGIYVVANFSKFILMFMALGFLMRLFVPLGASLSRQATMAFIGACVLSLGNRFFSHLTTHVFQMNRLYGAFASIPIFLFWIYFFWMTLITCILLCSDRWRQISRFKLKA